ncbi:MULTISPECIES: PEP-CTERM sorting domain-containing protein [unclassified Microcoleus]|uniref:PEP-CTERM sorting domain-containing protein n=1 Tax=unclassified Microcoleus TaxID=2642155 RepID=UPI002FCFFBAB
MSQKLRLRLGSAIASTILSYAAVSFVGVDQAQAAVLTYNFQVENGEASGFFKLNNSSLTGIGIEEIGVSEGRLNTFLNLSDYGGGEAKQYYDLAGFTVLFYQGAFRGLQAGGSDELMREYISPPDEPGAPFSFKYSGGASWSMATNGITSDDMWTSYFRGYKEVYIIRPDDSVDIVARSIVRDTPVSYTLVNTQPEPVPEPLTAGGTALALAGLSWLKHKKKMAA